MKFKTVQILISILMFSCVSQKPIIKNIDNIDNYTPIYYSNNENSLFLNGVNVYSFGRVYGSTKEGAEILGSKSSISDLFNYPLGKSDYLFTLEPSLSISGKYLVKVNNDFSLIKLNFKRDVDIDIMDVSKMSRVRKIALTIPKQEYEDEKYFIPWSKKNDSFFGFKKDSLFQIFPEKKSKFLLHKNKLYDFIISPSEESALVYANDTLFLYNLITNQNSIIFSVGKILGINRKFLRSFSWSEDESMIAFSEGWKIYFYNIQNGSLEKIKAKEKVFFTEWIDKDNILIVTGDFPSDMSAMQSTKQFKIHLYSFLTKKFNTIHKRYNHEPFNIKPRLSPSKKLILFSERKLNGPYQVKLMTLDGQFENILAEGYLPFWGSPQK